MFWHGMVLDGIAWYGIAWYGMVWWVWYGMLLHGMVGHGNSTVIGFASNFADVGKDAYCSLPGKVRLHLPFIVSDLLHRLKKFDISGLLQSFCGIILEEYAISNCSSQNFRLVRRPRNLPRVAQSACLDMWIEVVIGRQF